MLLNLWSFFFFSPLFKKKLVRHHTQCLPSTNWTQNLDLSVNNVWSHFLSSHCWWILTHLKRSWMSEGNMHVIGTKAVRQVVPVVCCKIWAKEGALSNMWCWHDVTEHRSSRSHWWWSSRTWSVSHLSSLAPVQFGGRIVRVLIWHCHDHWATSCTCWLALIFWQAWSSMFACVIHTEVCNMTQPEDICNWHTTKYYHFHLLGSTNHLQKRETILVKCLYIYNQ